MIPDQGEDRVKHEELLLSARAGRQKARRFPKAGEKGLGKVFVSRPRKHKLIAHELGAKTMLPAGPGVKSKFLTVHSCEETLATVFEISSPSHGFSSVPRLAVENHRADLSSAVGLADRGRLPC